MKIAVSADCFASFTSGFPVRGMMLELIKQNPEWQFQLYYTRREWPKELADFYEEINSLPNVEVCFFKDSRKRIAIKRLFGLKYVSFDNDVDLFLSPGNPEFIRGYKGPSICSVADLSTIKGLSTGKYSRFYKHWVKCQWKRTLPWTTSIVSISNFTKGDIVDYFPEVASKVKTIYNGIDNHWFEGTSSSQIIQQKFGIDKPYFIWWGLISRRKNVERLIRGYKLARTKVPSLPKLLLVGKISDHMEYIREEFDDNIINIPFQDNATLRNLVTNSNGLIFPSLYEGFGLPIIEAFSQGINVACSVVTSLSEISGGNAVLFDPLNIEEIANAIIRLYNIGSNAVQLKAYTSKFTYANAAQQYSNLILKTINNFQS